jgi:hypothetical protein
LRFIRCRPERIASVTSGERLAQRRSLQEVKRALLVTFPNTDLSANG